MTWASEILLQMDFSLYFNLQEPSPGATKPLRSCHLSQGPCSGGRHTIEKKPIHLLFWGLFKMKSMLEENTTKNLSLVDRLSVIIVETPRRHDLCKMNKKRIIQLNQWSSYGITDSLNLKKATRSFVLEIQSTSQ